MLLGVDHGKYPHGNSVVVRGPDRRVIIDPSLSLWEPDTTVPEVDQVLLTHVHEDHVAGLSQYLDTPVAVNHRDAPHLASLDGLVEMYGIPQESVDDFAAGLVQDFHFVARPDVEALDDDHVVDLGGGVTVTAVQTPGHTAGHTAWLIEPDGVLVIGDIDLTGFGPYYGDVVSSLDDFVDSMARVREIEAAWYVTFHHKAVVEGHAAFVEAIDAYAAVVDRRDDAILAYLDQPRTIADLIDHRFLYRPHVDLPWVDSAEERTSRRHLARLAERGHAVEVATDTWVRS